MSDNRIPNTTRDYITERVRAALDAAQYDRLDPMGIFYGYRAPVRVGRLDYVVEVAHDDDATSPREYDNGTLFQCWGNSRNDGLDEISGSTPLPFPSVTGAAPDALDAAVRALTAIVDEHGDWGDTHRDASPVLRRWDKWLAITGNTCALYTFSASGQSQGDWLEGVALYDTASDVTPEWAASEAAEFVKWYDGETHRFTVYNAVRDDDGDVLESIECEAVGGYVGDDHTESGLLEAVVESIATDAHAMTTGLLRAYRGLILDRRAEAAERAFSATSVLDYVVEKAITARVVEGPTHVEADEHSGEEWAHTAYTLELNWNGRVMSFAWRAGMAHDIMPNGATLDVEHTADVFDALLSERDSARFTDDYAEYAMDMGIELNTHDDLRRVRALFARLEAQCDAFDKLAGPVDLDTLADLERR